MSVMKNQQVILRLFRLASVVYLGFIGILFVLQREIIFLPAGYSEQQGRALAEERGLLFWKQEGVFHGWKDVVEGGETAALIFHGNAGGAVHRDYFRDLFRNVDGGMNISVYLLEYPGYGFREGRPSEEMFREAALKAYDAIYERYRTLLLVGESIGSGTATRLATEREVDGVLLITPFNRLSAVAAHHYPWLPVRLLLRDHFRNDKHLQEFSGPVAFVVAGRDRVIPFQLALDLYEGYDGPKLWRLQEQADHNSIFFGSGKFWAEVMRFLLHGPVAD